MKNAWRFPSLMLLAGLYLLPGCGGSGRNPADEGRVRPGQGFGTPQLIPIPKTLIWTGVSFRLDATTDIVSVVAGDEVARQAVQRVRGAAAAAGLPQLACRTGGKFARGANHIVLRAPTPAESAASPELALPEAYALTVSSWRVSLIAKTSRGLFCAAQTLAQMLGASPIPGCKVVDWPTLRFRALHVPIRPDRFPDARIYPALIEAAARLKYNALVIDFSGQVELSLHPEAVAMTGAVTQATVREWAHLARSYGMEIIPSVQSWGHADWSFGLGNVFYDRDIAPDCPLYSAMFALPPGMRGQNTFYPGSQQAYRALTDSYSELLYLLGNPRYLHIGGDEAWAVGYWRGQKTGDPVVDGLAWLRRLAGFLRGRGVRMMMWGDMFLDPNRWLATSGPGCNSRPEAPTARILAHLPKDVIIADWHYRVRPDYPTLPYFQSKGFEVVAAPWGLQGYDNQTNFDRRAALSGALGVIQTTWRMLKTDTGFVPFGAESAWNGGRRTQADMALNLDNWGHQLLDPLMYPNWQDDVNDPKSGPAIYPPFTTPTTLRSEQTGDSCEG